MATVLVLLNALAAIPKIAAFVEDFAAACALWFVQRQNNQTLTAISDAAALASRAVSDEDRFKAAETWQSALSRPRASTN